MSNFWHSWQRSGFWKMGLLWLIKAGGFCIATACLALLLTTKAYSNSHQDLEAVKEKVIKDIRSLISPDEVSRYEIDVQNMDSRLRLPACDKGLLTKLSQPTQIIGRQSIEVRCSGNRPWKIYLQVNILANIEIPVLKQALASGSLISSSDLDTLTIKLGADSKPIVRNSSQLIGKKVKRHLNPGTPILVSQIEAPNVIQRGQKVSLEYESNGLMVRMTGKSNQDGAQGDWIKVVNLNSGKTVEGRVNASGNVSVQN